MSVWKLVFSPRDRPDWTLEQVAGSASLAGYPMFEHGGKIYRFKGTTIEDGYTDTGNVPEMFEQPDIFCIMDAKKEKIAMNETGPVLLANPGIAMIMAENLGGEPMPFYMAIYLQDKARENASPLILPEPSRLILPS